MTAKMYGFNKHGSFHNVVSHSDNKVATGTVFNEKQIRMEVTLNNHGLFKGTLPTFIRRD
jgi:ribosomal protein L31